MSYIAAVIVPIALTFLVFVYRGRRAKERDSQAPFFAPRAMAEEPPADPGGTSVIHWKTVQKSIGSGAPGTPWKLRREDREAMGYLESYFARAIPNPGEGNQAYIEETLGHGGPQLELHVPILRTRGPIAVLARSWSATSESMESKLFFAGAVDRSLATVVAKIGFESIPGSSDTEFAVFRNGRGHAHQRSA